MSDRLRILMTNMNYRSTVVGGGQTSLQVLAEGLVRQGHEVTVVSIGDSPFEETANGVHAIRLPIRNRYWPFDDATHSVADKALWHARDIYNSGMAGDLEGILMEVNPDIMHSNVMAGWSVAIWASAAKHGIPIVHTLRDYYLVCLRSERFKNGRACQTTCAECLPFKVFRSKASRDITAVVGNSAYTLDKHLELGAFARTPVRRVIYNGFHPPSPLPERIARGNRLRLGFLGRLAVEKGIELLLDAVRTLPSREVELVIAGSGELEYERHLRHRFASENITFLGFTRPLEFFPRIDALVVPSLWPEPLPRTAFEAYGFGVPILGSDRGGIPETIEEGITGFVFSPEDPIGFRSLIESLAKNPGRLDAMRPAVLDRSRDFNPERVIRDYTEVYEQALSAEAQDGARR